MKFNFNKDNLQIISLLVAAIAILITIFGVIFDPAPLEKSDNELILVLAATIICGISVTYTLMIIRRINPKKYIYISCSSQDKKVALSIAQTLHEHFEKLSKYRFEVRTADTVPFGDDMYTTMKEYVKKSDIIIIVVSNAYISSEWCKKEFTAIEENGKRIVPVVLESYNDLSRLPVDISNIKALSLSNCSTQEEFNKQLLLLAKDLVRQRVN